MKLDILTPHFHQPDYLQRCILSVSRQTEGDPGIDLQITHHIQDGGGLTPEFVHEKLFSINPNADYRLNIQREEDDGMYDALNRAFARTSGEVIGHLNCDEQYLPGTLAKVADLFAKNPDLMILSGSAVITKPDGSYLCSRIPISPGYYHTAVCHLSLFTASTFYRRSLIEELGTYFDTNFRAAGDADLICRILKRKITIRTVRDYFSVFVDSGDNLALSETAKIEYAKLLSEASALTRSMQSVISLYNQFRKLLHGCYFLKAFSYTFIDSGGVLVEKHVEKPSGIWKSRRDLRKK